MGYSNLRLLFSCYVQFLVALDHYIGQLDKLSIQSLKDPFPFSSGFHALVLSQEGHLVFEL